MSSNTYTKNAIAGGAPGALDEIDGLYLADGDRAFVITTSGVYLYYLDATSGETEFSPNVIAPDKNPGTKRWILKVNYAEEDTSEWYGAVGNDSTDDTTAIQTALTNRDTVKLLLGKTYLVTSTLTVPADTVLDGAGATIHYTGTRNSAFNVTGDNVTIKNLHIEGPNTTDVYKGHSIGISCIGTSSVDYTEYLSVRNCIIKFFGQSGIFTQYVTGINMTDNHFERLGGHGVRALSSNNGLFSGNTVKDIYPGNTGTRPYFNAYGIALTVSGADPICTKWRIANNHFENIVSWEGVDTHSGSFITIANNTFKDVRQPVALTTSPTTDATSISVTGNVMEGFKNGEIIRDDETFETGSGIAANLGETGSQGLGVVINGNTIKNHGGKATGNVGGGIKVERARGAVVSNNFVQNAYRYGIRIAANVTDAVVTGNTIYTVNEIEGKKHGISFATTTQAVCDNNQVFSVGTNAFSIPTPASATYGVIFGAGNKTPDSTAIMAADDIANIKSGSFMGDAKSWIKFNGSTATINNSYGVTSIVRNSVGYYTITWDTNVSNGVAIVSGRQYFHKITVMGDATTEIKTYDSAGVLTDDTVIGVVRFGFIND